MTSAYDEAATTPRGAVKLGPVTGQELDNPETLAGMEERSFSRTSLATGDSAGVEAPAASSSAEISLPPGESSFDENSTSVHGEDTPKTTGEHEEVDGKDDTHEANLNCSTSSSNETNDTLVRMDRTRNKESSFLEEHEQHGEREESISVLPAVENAATCTSRKGQVKDQIKDHRNQSVLEARAQERHTCDDDRAEENSRNSQTASQDEPHTLRAHCENAEEPRPDEAQDEVADREIAQGCQNDCYNFYDAVRSGNVKRVSALIASGCVQNLDEPDWNVSGDPPLLVAATNQCLPVLSALLANGCDPAARSPRGETALHRVIQNGGPSNVLKFVEDLLKHGCPPSVKEAGSGSTALHVLSRQLAHTPLKSLHHNFDVALTTLELLAKAGLVNIKDHQGRSPLHILASSAIFDNNNKSHIESLIVTLLDAGADTALKNDRGETPLHESLECGALNTAELLIPHTPTGITSRYGETPLHIASRKNYVNMVTQLLAHGEDPGAQDAGGNTPLHLAAARGFHQTVSLLVTSPLAQLENVNIDGLTALQVATESRFINAVRILLKAGADPSQIMHYCATVLRQHPDISLLVNHELTRRRQLAA
ncbi:serine/threonine-protein phosphatase 6 regulatory ankyrin repeat subunit B [Harpegnathos saltator]|uniref:Ankyrin-2 n=1 Tax=Harpegnathos saltator TaxID=610380 RepID=E2BJ43_HARSA|nr:serine/threonine-protein phosphatase 6 regulatory ankyrin repeat subunit B [Harpegnathos saltator]EFN84193.1 Ankyrin-2 [Harpegnathos saltator]